MLAITPERTELKLSLGHSSIKRIERIRELTGDFSLESIFDQTLELLEMREEKKRGKDSNQTAAQSTDSNHSTQSNQSSTTFKDAKFSWISQASQSSQPTKSTQPADSPLSYSSHSRFIPITLKREIFRRSKGCCEFIDSKTLKRCESRFRLQLDQIYPRALGGKTELKNLRHLCPNHNLRAAQTMGLNQGLRL